MVNQIITFYWTHWDEILPRRTFQVNHLLFLTALQLFFPQCYVVNNTTQGITSSLDQNVLVPETMPAKWMHSSSSFLKPPMFVLKWKFYYWGKCTYWHSQHARDWGRRVVVSLKPTQVTWWSQFHHSCRDSLKFITKLNAKETQRHFIFLRFIQLLLTTKNLLRSYSTLKKTTALSQIADYPMKIENTDVSPSKPSPNHQYHDTMVEASRLHSSLIG